MEVYSKDCLTVEKRLVLWDIDSLCWNLMTSCVQSLSQCLVLLCELGKVTDNWI